MYKRQAQRVEEARAVIHVRSQGVGVFVCSAYVVLTRGGIGEQLYRRHLVDAGAFVRQCSTVAGLDLAELH